MADILHHIQIKATPPEIYDALTTIAGVKSWWTDACELSNEEGGRCRFWFDQKQTCFTMQATRLLPHQRIFWQCMDGPKEWIGTELWWEITPTGSQQCQLDFKHMNWHSDEGAFPLCNTVWGGLMFRLKAYCEHGTRDPMFVN